MKSFKQILITVLMMTISAISWADKLPSGNLYYESINGTSNARVVGLYQTTATVIQIPSTVTLLNKQYKVTEIGNSAFKDNTSITTLTLNNASNLEVIGDNAFEGCTSLYIINFSSAKSLKTIGKAAFKNAGNSATSTFGYSFPSSPTIIYDKQKTVTETVTDPDGTTRTVSRQEDDSQTYNLDTRYLSFPATLETIGEEAFSGCTRIVDIFFNAKNLKSIGKDAFRNCTNTRFMLFRVDNNDTNDYLNALPDLVIGDYAFENCFSTKSSIIELPLSTVSLGEGTFKGTSRLYKIHGFQLSSEGGLTWRKYNNYLPPRLTSIPKQAFMNSPILNVYSFVTDARFSPSGITSIGQEAFDSNTNLVAFVNLIIDETGQSTRTDYKLPDGVTTIDKWAFNNCSKLPRIILPASLETIGQGAFQGCSAMKKIYATDVVASPTNWDANAFNNSDLRANARLYVALGKEEAYHNADATKDIAHLIADCSDVTIDEVLTRGIAGSNDYAYHYKLGADIENYNTVTTAGNSAFMAGNDQAAYELPDAAVAYPYVNDLMNGGYTGYRRGIWLQIDGISTLVAGMVPAAGYTFTIADKQNPTFAFASGYDTNNSYAEITAATVKAASASYGENLNNYCPANFATTSDYHFVAPQPCEYANVLWSVYNGNNTFFTMSRVDTRPEDPNGRVYNPYNLQGGYTISTDYLANPSFSFTTNNYYDFTAVIKRKSAGSLTPSRLKVGFTPNEGAVSDEWEIYPIAITTNKSVVTGINNPIATAAPVVSVTYYNTAGLQSDRPFKGVNIVVTKRADGSSSATKRSF